VVKVGGVAGGALDCGEDRLRHLSVKLHLGAAPLAVDVTVGDHLLEVIGLTTVDTVVVRREPELFE
jgi:hypothetical protein